MMTSDQRRGEGLRLSLSLSLIFFGLSDLRYLVRRRLSIRQRIFFSRTDHSKSTTKCNGRPFFFS